MPHHLEELLEEGTQRGFVVDAENAEGLVTATNRARLGDAGEGTFLRSAGCDAHCDQTTLGYLTTAPPRCVVMRVGQLVTRLSIPGQVGGKGALAETSTEDQPTRPLRASI